MKMKAATSLKRLIFSLAKRSKGNRGFIATIIFSYLALFFLLSVSPQFDSLFNALRLSEYTIGEPAPQDLFADRDITFLDDEATEIRREAISKLVSPVFSLNDQIIQRSLTRFTEFSTLFADARTRSSSAEKVFLEIQAESPELFSLELISDFLNVGNILPNLSESRVMLETIMNKGVVGKREPIITEKTDTIEMIRWEGRKKIRSLVPSDSILELSSIGAFILGELSSLGVDERNAGVIAAIVTTFCEENAFFESELTEANKKQAIDDVEPVVKKLIRGERIATGGMIVTEDDLAKISALEKFSATVNVNSIVGSGLLILALYLLAFVFVRPPITKNKRDRKTIYLMLVAIVLFCSLAVLVVRVAPIQTYLPLSLLLPTALIAMLIAILVSPADSIVLSFILAVLILPVTEMDLYAALFTFLSGCAGTLVVAGAEKMIELVRASLILSLLQGCIMAALAE